MTTKNIIIIGGGITGLTAAYYLQKDIAERDLPFEVKLLEASNRLGGKINTKRMNGFIIERGPDSFLARKQPAVKLANDLGLSDQLIRNRTGQAYIFARGALHEIPQGSHMGIPTQIRPFLESALLSTRGKLRAGLDYILPRGKEVGDQSLGKFLRRRLGDELVENSIEPLLSGIYSGDLDQMSLMATFPHFLELEQRYRSLIKGLQQTMSEQKTTSQNKRGKFFSFKNGLETIVAAIIKQTGNELCHINTKVEKIVKTHSRYRIYTNRDACYEADAIIVAVPHHVLPHLFQAYDFFQPLTHVPLTSVANIALAFDQSQIKNDIHGTGFVVSRNSNNRITACTGTHKKWQHTAPDGKALLRAYVGQPSDQAIVRLSDTDMTNIVLRDLTPIMNIVGDPEFAVVTRWEKAMPQYTVGHKARIRQIKEKMEKSLPGVFLAGSSYGGVGIPDCIAQGEQAKRQAFLYLQKQ